MLSTILVISTTLLAEATLLFSKHRERERERERESTVYVYKQTVLESSANIIQRKTPRTLFELCHARLFQKSFVLFLMNLNWDTH